MKKADVIRHFGGTHRATADALGISRPAVTQWPDIVPERMAWRVQQLTNGKLRVDPGVYRKPSAAA